MNDRGTPRRGGRDPVPIGKLIRDLVSRRGLAGSLPLQAVREGFQRVAGEQLARRVRVVALQRGTVTLETDSAALAYELKSFQSGRWLAELRRQPGCEFVTSLRFRAGKGVDGSG